MRYGNTHIDPLQVAEQGLVIAFCPVKEEVHAIPIQNQSPGCLLEADGVDGFTQKTRIG